MFGQLIQAVFVKNKENTFEKNTLKIWKIICYQEYHGVIYLDILLISFNIVNITLILF